MRADTPAPVSLACVIAPPPHCVVLALQVEAPNLEAADAPPVERPDSRKRAGPGPSMFSMMRAQRLQRSQRRVRGPAVYTAVPRSEPPPASPASQV